MRDLGRTLVLFACLCAGPAQAHLLKVFAFVENGVVQGHAYFAGGSRAAGLAYTISTPHEGEVARGTTDADGAFRHRAATRADHRIEVTTGDGHAAAWTVRADELPGLPAADADQSRQAEPAPPPSPNLSSGNGSALPPGLTAEIEQAVARQVRPLREQLLAWEEQARFTEVLGGVGYIVGIAGLALWWRDRRGPRP